MSRRILTPAALTSEPTVLSPPSRELDDATTALVERERAAAHAAGVAEGRRVAREEASEEAAAVVEALARAADRAIAAVRAQHEELAAALATRVTAAVAAVLGHEPDDAGAALVDRLAATLAEIDDPAVTVHVAPSRHVLVERSLAERPGVTVEVDARLAVDDARVTGAYAAADLRLATLVAALDDVLAGEQPLGPLPPPGVGAEVTS